MSFQFPVQNKIITDINGKKYFMSGEYEGPYTESLVVVNTPGCDVVHFHRKIISIYYKENRACKIEFRYWMHLIIVLFKRDDKWFANIGGREFQLTKTRNIRFHQDNYCKWFRNCETMLEKCI